MITGLNGLNIICLTLVSITWISCHFHSKIKKCFEVEKTTFSVILFILFIYLFIHSFIHFFISLFIYLFIVLVNYTMWALEKLLRIMTFDKTRVTSRLQYAEALDVCDAALLEYPDDFR